MSLSLGIVGLPNVGKSTLFNALLKRQAALAANYPFATIEPNIGIVDVPDERLNRLAEIVRVDYGQRQGDRELPEQIIPAVVKFYDIAGLVKGASSGEGLGNAFLSHIREVDALVQVVRAFDDDNVVRAGATDPASDIEIINTELILADIQVIDKKLEKGERELKSDKTAEGIERYDLLLTVRQALGEGKLANSLNLSTKQKDLLKEYNLLTFKPLIYVFNVSESEAGADIKSIHSDVIDRYNGIKISAKIESEIASMDDPADRDAFMSDLGLRESGLNQVIRKGFDILGLQVFLTMGPKEVRAWTVKKGSSAPEAAGVIHTDFQRGFISAEIVAYEDLASLGSLKLARDKGLLRLEGKTYIMRDGDVVEFNFSV
ncbi:redox-regulated ATPase YchF [candidate division WWE3 bacterium]|uniref:Ribosome-binding ATPase YchF n=1 Tax=candidate division WWE3 bacterium TaxID=2053526 RepID=A0A7X9DKV3_UNCKA|nr:redox-regulated ATPase YchF [candidate division WWE3 bacterium]